MTDAPRYQIEIRNVTRRIGDRIVLDDLRLFIRPGEFFSLLGPSGCGKTTLLRCIAGFDRPDAGSVWLDGEDVTTVPPHRRDVNMVFQSYALFPHLSVFENVAFGLRLANATDVSRRVAEALDWVRLSSCGSRKTTTLSGGEQQRVALARAVVNRPKALLLDEPLGALDLVLRHGLQEELRRLQRELRMTFVYVTHDQDEALSMSDRVAVMNSGAIEQIGTPSEIYHHPNSEFVARFVGTANKIHIDGRTFVVRPECIRLGDRPGHSVTVTDVVFLGSRTLVIVDHQGARLVVETANSSGTGFFAVGQKTTISWDAAAMHPIPGNST